MDAPRVISGFLALLAAGFHPGGAVAGPSAKQPLVDLDELEAPSSTSGGPDALFDVLQRVDFESEALIESDVRVYRTGAAYEQQRGDFTLGTTLGYTWIDLEYQSGASPAASLDEYNREAQLDLGWRLHPELELTAIGRVYEGYPDYRAVWIGEYYRRDWDPFPEYVAPDPQGWAVATGANWDVFPGSARIEADVAFGEDDIVPGWSFGAGGLESARSRLATWSGGLAWEQAVTGRLMARLEGRVQRITAREPRYQVKTDWAAALDDSWTLRLNAGVTTEDPSFDAWFVGALLDYRIHPGWHLSLAGRYYEDTGEIETSGFSTAAPGLSAYEVGVALLYDRIDLSVRLYTGLYDTAFDPLDPINPFMGNLYDDREWWITRLAVTYQF